jgi:hypothetical protein
MIRRTDLDLQAKKSWKTSMRCSHLLCALYIADRFNSPPQGIAQVAWTAISRRSFFCFGLGGSIRTGTSKPIVRLLQLRTCTEWSTDYHFSRIQAD